MNNNWSDLDASSFFRIITLPGLDEGKLGLPKKFIHEYANELSNTISLSVPSGGIWTIGIERAENVLWLHDGWQRFVEHYRIGCGYFLLFKYKGNSEFDVAIFDLTATEIEYSTDSNERRMFSNVGQSTDAGEEKFCGHSDDQPVEILDSSDSEKEIGGVNPDPGPSSRWTCPDRKKFVRKTVSDDDQRWEYHIATKVFKSDNPYFTAIMKGYNLGISFILNVPAQFSSTYLQNVKDSIEIYDSDGKKWNASILRRKGRVTSLSKGWSIFVKEKELCLGDVCVFELIKSTPVALKVSIFRVKERGELN